MRTLFGVMFVLLVVVVPFQAMACDDPPPFDRVDAVLHIVGQDDCIEWGDAPPFVVIVIPDCITD